MNKLLLIIAIFMLFFISCGDNSVKVKVSCDNVDCGEGVCKIVDNKAICECNEGYLPVGLSCVTPGCLDLDCNNGRCVEKDGVPICECRVGYSGEDCTTCDEGYQDNDENGECLRDCENVGISCGDYGECDDSSGVVVCNCEAGWKGSVCNIYTGSKLSLKFTDQWGRDINFSDFTVVMTRDNEEILVDSFDINLNLLKAGKYSISVTDNNDDYFPLEFEFNYNGQNEENSITDISLINDENSADYPVTKHAYVYNRETPDDVKINWKHDFYIGIAHKWFAPTGSPFSKGNRVELFIDGESAWNSIADDLDAAQSEIDMVTWGWDDNHELRRPMEILPESQRADNRIISLMHQEDNVKSRIIIAQFWKQDSWLTGWLSDSAELKAFAENPNDNVEFMIQANPTNENYRIFFQGVTFSERLLKKDKDYDLTFGNTFVEEQEITPIVCGDLDNNDNCTFYHDVDLSIPVAGEAGIASYHQKHFTIDRKIAYVGGMNSQEKYWDTAKHKVFDHRRMPFDASTSDREEVRDGDEDGIKKPSDFAPYKDYFTKIEGPLVKDVHDIFSDRWNYILYEDVKFAEFSTANDVMNNYPDPIADGVDAQITVTMPRPFQKNTILESQLLAIKQAKYYIYIEDQYFRIPILNAAIGKRMDEEPNLKLIVITQPISSADEYKDLACYWTTTSYEFFQENFSDRVAFFQLRSFDFTYPDHDCEGVWTDTSCYGNEMEGYFKNFYVHAKMFMIDDKYMSIGSANKHNRGFIYEGEMNIAVHDKTWVTRERKRIFENILGDNYNVEFEAWNAEDIDSIFNRLKEVAQYNEDAYNAWDTDIVEGVEHRDIDLDIDYTGKTRDQIISAINSENGANSIPIGFLYPLSFVNHSDCLFEESVGEDAMK